MKDIGFVLGDDEHILAWTVLKMTHTSECIKIH